MSDVETPAANGAATDADIEITSPDSTAVAKLTSKIQLLEQDQVNAKVKIAQLEDEISSHESDKRALTSIAARASDLETELSRLQHDLIASESDAQEANAKVSEFAAKEREKDEKVNLLSEKLRESETEKAREIGVLMSRISEFEAKESEKTAKIEALLSEISEKDAKVNSLVEKLKESEEKGRELRKKLKESESKVSELESEEKVKNIKVNEMLEKLDQLQKEIVAREDVVEVSGSGRNWPVIAVGAGAVVTLGLVYLRHAKF